jgi:hypothetical protein
MAVLKGGDKLKDFLDRIGTAAEKNKNIVRAGFLENATYPDGTPVAMIAALQDFGAPKAGIPPRPFMRNAIAEHQQDWANGIAAQFKANNYDINLTLTQAGHAIVGDIKQSIIDTNEPALKPETIKRKGFAKPLIETSHLINSVDFEVDEG